VFGAHAFVWGTTSTVVRHRAVPDEILGRVGGVYRVAITGGLVIGTPLGGLIARSFGLTAPFWFGFVGSAYPGRAPMARVRAHRPGRRLAAQSERGRHRIEVRLTGATGVGSGIHADGPP